MKVQIVYKNDMDEYFYKERDGRSYTDVHTTASDIYTDETCRNKGIPSLRNLIVQVKQENETNYRPQFCAIYSRLSGEYDESHPIIQWHGDSNFETEIDRPYTRTSEAILHQQAELLSFFYRDLRHSVDSV